MEEKKIETRRKKSRLCLGSTPGVEVVRLPSSNYRFLNDVFVQLVDAQPILYLYTSKQHLFSRLKHFNYVSRYERVAQKMFLVESILPAQRLHLGLLQHCLFRW